MAPAGSRRAISLTSVVDAEVPVGLFGFVTKTMRVRSGDGGEHLVERKAEIGSRRDPDRSAAGDGRIDFEDLERRLRHDRFRHTAPVRLPQSGDGSGHDAFVEPVGQRQP